jgi:hypothetical protein
VAARTAEATSSGLSEVTGRDASYVALMGTIFHARPLHGNSWLAAPTLAPIRQRGRFLHIVQNPPRIRSLG